VFPPDFGPVNPLTRVALARCLLVSTRMERTAKLADMMTLARLHAALDSVVETEQLIAMIKDTSMEPQPALGRVADLVGEARELLRRLLIRPDSRQPVENPSTR
jgi:hypothetical protein